MFRPTDGRSIETPSNWALYDPIIPYGELAINSDGSGFKIGDGTNVWSNLTYQGSNAIRSKQVQSSREPLNNELLLFCDATDKWIYRLQHCFDTVSNWESNSSVFPTCTMLIETDNITQIPTGRFKLGDGATSFPTLPWFGTDFNLSDFSVGESIEFNGSGWDPVTYLKSTELQSATIPTGKFHKDDGTWAIMDTFTGLETVEADQGVFSTIYVGGFPTEATTITLTSDGTDLFSDGNKVWTQYNDGSGSGLDADTLDGYHATSFATITHTHDIASDSASGFLPILENTTIKYLRDDGTWQTVTATNNGDVMGPATSVIGNIVTFNSIDGKSISNSGYDVTDFATTAHTHDYSGIYLGIGAKASDSELLDGLNSTAFATTAHTHTTYVSEDDALAYSIAFGG